MKHEGELAAERALEAAKALRTAREMSATLPDYLALRRAVACGAPFFRREAATWTEPLLGPPRSANEAGGAMLALDGALESGDRGEALRQIDQIERALTVLDHAMSRSAASAAELSPALSDAAYDLGATALESSSGIPAGGAAVLADLQGTLDAIERGATSLASAPGSPRASKVIELALEALRTEAAPLRARLSAISSSIELSDRASFVLGTGRLGVAARRLAEALGASPKLPYRARTPTADNTAQEPVSALTLPAPRRAAPGSKPDPPGLAELGARLFHEKRLSKGDDRSCASCHDPKRGYADGQRTPRSLDPAVTLRHTPTLLYTPLNAAQMWDGRIVTPERQALGVIHARAEMGLTEGELKKKLQSIPAYRGALQGEPLGLDETMVARALVAFENAELVPASAPIDRFARGEEGALSADERAGLDVFAGAGRCARCHIPPFFGGSRPRDFAVPVFTVIGVPTDVTGRTLDPDRGRAAVTGRPRDEGSFKTPTVRDVALTAPYFHNGRFDTLDDVVAFYDRGGGRGAGLKVENQDPDVRPLKLTKEQIRTLLVFLRAGLRDP